MGYTLEKLTRVTAALLCLQVDTFSTDKLANRARLRLQVVFATSDWLDLGHLLRLVIMANKQWTDVRTIHSFFNLVDWHLEHNV